MKKRFWTIALCAVMGLTTLCEAQNSVSLIEESPVSMANNWWPGLLIPRATITEAAPGSKIVMDYEITDPKDPKFCLAANYGKTPLPGFEGTEQDATEETRMNLPLKENGTYTYTITEETINQLGTSDFHGWDKSVRIVGQGFNITKLELVTEGAGDDSDEESLLEECPYVMNEAWWPGLLIPREKVTGAQAGWRIVMDYEVAEGVDDARFCLTTNYGKTELPGFDGTLEDTSTTTRKNMPLTGKGTYSYTITEETISQLGNSEFHGWDKSVRVVGTGFTITKLVLAKSEGGVTGINNILDNENAPVEYFNLQGRKIENPSNGIYIRRQGTKVTKVLVK